MDDKLIKATEKSNIKVVKYLIEQSSNNSLRLSAENSYIKVVKNTLLNKVQI